MISLPGLYWPGSFLQGDLIMRYAVKYTDDTLGALDNLDNLGNLGNLDPREAIERKSDHNHQRWLLLLRVCTWR